MGPDGALQPIHAASAIGVIASDGAALVAARQDVIETARQFDPQWSGHGPQNSKSPPEVKHND